jgi:hypothetical protein
MIGFAEIWSAVGRAAGRHLGLSREAHSEPSASSPLRFACTLHIALLFATLISLQAGVFDDANRLYEQGKYAEAIPLYETMLKSGHHSPGVLFNLGNAYFKNGELGRAILNYRRAARIAPRDPDVQANLRFARERVSGANSVQPTFIEQLLGRFRLNELATATALIFWLWLALLCFARFRPTLRPQLRVYTLLSGSLFSVLLITLFAARQISSRQTAIVIDQQATIRLGPLAESQPAYTATDGAELLILAQREGWLQVSDRSGRTGWLDAKNAAIFR